MLNGFQDRRIQPLCHLSVTGNDSIESTKCRGDDWAEAQSVQQPQGIQVDDERFMREALAEAERAAAEGEVPIGAVVVHEGRVIARAHNRRETDADPSAHAEFSAMVAAAQALGRWRLTGCTVYVTLEPCLMCAGLMVNARIDRCVFGAADPKGGAVGTLFDVSSDERLNHAFGVTSGVLEDECAAVLRSFFNKLREQRGAGTEQASAQGAAAPADSTNPTPTPCTCRASHSARSSCEPSRAPQRHAAPTGAHFRTRAPHVLLAVDSFKGSASSEQAESWLEESILRAAPDAHVTRLPVADGGEGTLAALQTALDGEMRSVPVQDPFGEPIEAAYLLGTAHASSFSQGPHGSRNAEAPSIPNTPSALNAPNCPRAAASPVGTPIAVIEMAQAAGLFFSPATHEAALSASTFGVGQLILEAVSRGARTIYIGLGGSATSDGGAGMLQALGALLLDAVGKSIRPGLQGLRDIASIELAPAREALQDVSLIALTDVSNPLVGNRGALRIFGPQKGLARNLAPTDREAALSTCDSWMTAYAARLTAARDALDGTPLRVARPGERPRSLAGVPGAGAAGGLGAALLALGAELKPGIDTVLDLAGFDELARQASLVITGEGALDSQTAAGKAPVGIARRAKTINPRVPVIAVCGSRADDLDALYRTGIDLAIPIMRKPMPLDQALTAEETRQNLICAGETAIRAAMLGQRSRQQ